MAKKPKKPRTNPFTWEGKKRRKKTSNKKPKKKAAKVKRKPPKKIKPFKRPKKRENELNSVEAAEYLDLSPSHVRALAREGILPCRKTRWNKSASIYFFTKKALDDFKKSRGE